MTFSYYSIKARIVFCFLTMTINFIYASNSIAWIHYRKSHLLLSSGPNLHLQKHRNYKFSILIKKHRLEFCNCKGLLVSRVGFVNC